MLVVCKSGMIHLNTTAAFKRDLGNEKFVSLIVMKGKYKYENIYSQHSMGLDAACRDTVLPVAWLM